ncbi:NAD(P)H-binding protein [Croceicoccus sp. YJ47]|uniref:NAD(P)H-binding protein n=1 Tax=Croceicoccus sp. YJ47 TaxID=2798724 RepID=UPI001920C23F|nr:NAD(P)H-binding protein [Croceicoccus sp. YJ47]QQN75314.1 SDR family oxidoreductase [Croceicoccus sp. YJ47]
MIGASGEVGEGVVRQLLAAGHDAVGSARGQAGLDALITRLGHPARLTTVRGSLASVASALALADAVGPVDAVIVAVNAMRAPSRLDTLTPEALAHHMHADVLTHFIAVRVFLPLLPKHGCFLGIGGGAADFILEGGAHVSMAQAALRQMYRGLAFERQTDAPALRELIVASVVAGRNHAIQDGAWVTADELGARVTEIVADPAAFAGTIWRIARRDASGHPRFTHEEGTPARALPL